MDVSMTKKTILCVAVAALTVASTSYPAEDISFTQAENKIDVMCGEKLITSYLYDDKLTKPILYPMKSPSGLVITRGFPFETIPGESTDHPHHTGLFFTYDKVNRDGFWNNTTSPPQIKHVKTTQTKSGGGTGTLSVVLHWVSRKGNVLLEEKRDMVFSAEPNQYTVDFNIVLTAQNEKVVFGDTKEGMFAIRVADWLREEGGTGEYLNSEGAKQESSVWGRRAKWLRLEGQKDGKTIGIAIFNHPDGVNYPTYWMARGYGLFSANPLGQHHFQKATGMKNPQPLNLTLRPGESAVFRFRILLYEGSRTTEELGYCFNNFCALYPVNEKKLK